MKKNLLALAIFSILLAPGFARAVAISWEYSNSVLKPLSAVIGSRTSIGTTTATSLTTLTVSATSTATEYVLSLLNDTGYNALSVTDDGLASTTDLVVSTLGGSGTRCVQVSASGQLSAASGACASATGVFDFTPDTYAGVAVNATSTSLWLKATSPYSLIATSTFATYASSTQLTNSGNTWLTGMTSALLQTDSAGLIAEYAGTSCTNQFVRSISSLGAATCATVVAGDVDLADLTATNSTLTFSGTYDGQTARTIGLNLGNSNPWTALQTFANASSTQFSAASETFYIDSTGKVVAKDTTNNWSGRLSPTKGLVLQTGTTTTWTATSSGAYTPRDIAPYAGTARQVLCTTDASFLGVTIKINGTAIAPNYFIASTTRGTISITGNNTFSKGDVFTADFGTTTTASALSSSCTVLTTET